MSLIGLLIVLLIFCVIVWAVRQILAAFNIGQPINTVVQVIIVLIFILWLIQALGVVDTGPILRVR